MMGYVGIVRDLDDNSVTKQTFDVQGDAVWAKMQKQVLQYNEKHDRRLIVEDVVCYVHKEKMIDFPFKDTGEYWDTIAFNKQVGFDKYEGLTTGWLGGDKKYRTSVNELLDFHEI